MYRVSTYVARIGLHEQNEMEGLIDSLKNKGYSPMIRSMLVNIYNLVNLPLPDESQITRIIEEGSSYRFSRFMGSKVLGDILIKDSNIFTIIPFGGGSVQVSVIGNDIVEEKKPELLNEIEDAIKAKFDGRRARGMDFEWKPQTVSFLRVLRTHSHDINEDSEDDKKVKYLLSNYSTEDIKIADLLVNKQVRQFVIRLAQLKKITNKDINETIKTKEIEILRSLNLIKEEKLITCKQDQHTICIISNEDYIQKGQKNAPRCSLCNRYLFEENIVPVFSLTEKCKEMINNSKWMQIWITELLIKSGIKKERIKWGIEANGEELDIMVEDYNLRFFFELKDREFGLGDAYPFAYRIKRYAGKYGIVVTTDTVSNDAKKYFAEENEDSATKIKWLEGSNGIEEGIPKIVEEMSLSQINQTIQPFSDRIGFNLWPIIESKIKQNITN